MDRKSFKKIIRYIIMVIISIVICMMGVYIFIRYIENMNNTQINEIESIYPEFSGYINETVKYYCSLYRESGIYLGIFVLFVILCIIFIMMYFNHRDLIALNKKYDADFNAVLAQLENFSRGKFLYADNDKKIFLNSNEDYFNKENMYRISELFEYLSFYFSDLIEKMEIEEESTKSLITDISHQLKTPMAALHISYEILQKSILTKSESEEFLENIGHDIEKLEILIDELVNLSRLESHMIQIEPKLYRIKETIAKAVSQVFMKAYEKNIEIQLDMEEDIELMHDTKWTVEALANVLDNAVKYSYENKKIIVRVEKCTFNILIEIEDEGIGISPEELHNIYKRFYRGVAAEHMTDDGVGVGLYLTRKIIEGQGGTIVAKRKQKQGTIFRITLPL